MNPVERPARNSSSQGAMMRMIALIVLLLAAFLAYGYGGLSWYLSAEGMASVVQILRNLGQGWGLVGAGLFALIGALMIVINVPIVMLIVVASAVYGAAGAAFIGLFCFMIGNTLIFFIGQRLGKDLVGRLFSYTLPRFQSHFRRRGLATVIHLRLLFFGLPPVNWLLSVMDLKFRDFFLGTLIGGLPKLLLFSWLGGFLFEKLADGGKDLTWYSPELLAPVFAGLALSGLLRLFDGYFFPQPKDPVS